ncbi:MAG: LCP family protein [Actinobacteria bacterium]|nr:LCP family protein [Actinomycetota bacterium]
MPAHRRPWVASLLSALIPGAGQLYAGDRARGRRLIGVDLVLLVGAAIAVLFYQGEVVKAWVTLPTLSLIMVANLSLLGFRAWAAYDAYHLLAPHGGGLGAVVTLIMGVVVLVPHVALGYLNVVQYSLISEVFTTLPPSEPDVTTTATPGVVETTPEPVLWDGLERLNVLLLGSDVGEGRQDIRTDTMIVVSIDPESGDVAMVSLPRNFSGITLPPGMGVWECDCFPQLLNDLYFAAGENPDAFPGQGEPGPRALKATLGHLLDIQIHYYALVGLDGFVGIVDALGGVTIEVPNTIVDETYPHEDGVTIEHVVISEGTQHLDGHLALAYARIRRHADDFARMNRQRCVLGALAAQSSPLELLARYGAIAEVLKDNLETDIPRERLVDFIDILPRISMDRIGVLAVDRDYISGTDTGRTYYDEDRIRAEAQALFADPTSGGVEQLSLENACD